MTPSDGLNDMQKAFEQFMMQRGGGEAKKDSVRLKKEEQDAKEVERKQHALQQDILRAEKEYINLFKRFVSRVKGEWMELDDQTFHVVQAISGIRSRLPMESQLLYNLRQESRTESWSVHGNMNALGNHFFLRLQDVQLGLSYDLLQHEKMMEALRRLLSNLSDCHESLLRMLDGMMKHNLECAENYGGRNVLLTPSFQKAASLSSLMSDALEMMSLELYRKQILAQMIFDSAEDDLLVVTAKERFDEQGELNWSKQWSRDSENSCIQKETFVEIMRSV